MVSGDSNDAGTLTVVVMENGSGGAALREVVMADDGGAMLS